MMIVLFEFEYACFIVEYCYIILTNFYTEFANLFKIFPTVIMSTIYSRFFVTVTLFLVSFSFYPIVFSLSSTSSNSLIYSITEENHLKITFQTGKDGKHKHLYKNNICTRQFIVVCILTVVVVTLFFSIVSYQLTLSNFPSQCQLYSTKQNDLSVVMLGYKGNALISRSVATYIQNNDNNDENITDTTNNTQQDCSHYPCLPLSYQHNANTNSGEFYDSEIHSDDWNEQDLIKEKQKKKEKEKKVTKLKETKEPKQVKESKPKKEPKTATKPETKLTSKQKPIIIKNYKPTVEIPTAFDHISDLRDRQLSEIASIPTIHINDKDKQLVSVVMIVKNEAKGIITTLQSTLSYIDRYIIVDTGSTDNTVELITNWFQKNSQPEQWIVYHRQFADFSTTRNLALKLANQHTEFIFMLNGDDRLVGGAKMRTWLQSRKYLKSGDEAMYIVPINYGGISIGRSERIVRSANHFVTDWPSDEYKHWRYEGYTHEVYVSQHALQSGLQIVYINEQTDGFYIYHDIQYDTGVAKQERFQLDIQLLLDELQQDNPARRPRTLYYLAQSYYNLGLYQDAFKYYDLRLKTNYPRPTDASADNEKARSALLQSLCVPHLKSKSKSEIPKLLLKSYEYCATSYALFLLTQHYLSMGDTESAQYYAQRTESKLIQGTSVVCADDDAIVKRQLPNLLKELGLTRQGNKKLTGKDEL